MKHLKYIMLFASSYATIQPMHTAVPNKNASNACKSLVPSLLVTPDPAGFANSAALSEETEVARRVFVLGSEVTRLERLNPLHHANYKKRMAGLLASCNRLIETYGDKYPDAKTRLTKIAQKLI